MKILEDSNLQHFVNYSLNEPQIYYSANFSQKNMFSINIDHVNIMSLTEWVYSQLFPENDLQNPIVKKTFQSLPIESQQIIGASMLIARYCIYRLLSHYKVWSSSVWTYKTLNDYYGTQIEIIMLHPKVGQILDAHLYNLKHKNDQSKIEYILMTEYGRLLPNIVRKNWFIGEIDYNDLEFSNSTHLNNCLQSYYRKVPVYRDTSNLGERCNELSKLVTEILVKRVKENDAKETRETRETNINNELNESKEFNKEKVETYVKLEKDVHIKVEKVKEEVKEEVKQEVKEEVKQEEVKQVVKQEEKEEVIQEEVKEEVKEKVKEEVKEEVKLVKKETDVNEKIKLRDTNISNLNIASSIAGIAIDANLEKDVIIEIVKSVMEILNKRVSKEDKQVSNVEYEYVAHLPRYLLEYNLPLALVAKKENRYKVIDGYHRIASSIAKHPNTKILVIYCYD